ncbi:MAG: protocatechuate 3,4-dioxygenase [bacterium]|nr:protocatechuate 3,4-dioxygenase [bacterium]
MRARSSLTRRQLIASGLALAASAAAAGAAAAAKLLPTPRQTPGPFYPQRIPLESDNDLAQVGGSDRPAAGQLTHVFGRVVDEDGRPVRGAQVEIWQCDAFGFYHHPWDRRGEADPAFQGYGRMTVGADGGFRFRTIRPVPYPGRAPHIHFGIRGAGIGWMTTQMYLKGHPLNAADGPLNSVDDPAARRSLIVDLRPASNLEAGALAGRFDIVLGRNAFQR